MTNRRETLKIIGAIGATCAFPYASDELYGQHVHVAGAEAASSAPVFFKAEDFATVSRIADLIIPPRTRQARFRLAFRRISIWWSARTPSIN